MVSDFVKEKSDVNVVVPVFVGKSHHFKVVSPSESVYDVSVQVSCTCPFMGREGLATGRVCSHIVSVLKKMSGVKK